MTNQVGGNPAQPDIQSQFTPRIALSLFTWLLGFYCSISSDELEPSPVNPAFAGLFSYFLFPECVAVPCGVLFLDFTPWIDGCDLFAWEWMWSVTFACSCGFSTSHIKNRFHCVHLLKLVVTAQIIMPWVRICHYWLVVSATKRPSKP